MRALGRELRQDCRVYFTGGATALLVGWRASAVAIDLKIVPDGEAFAALARLKNQLDISLELASPDHFIPELRGWESRSPFVAREGKVSFYHLDPYSQALSKIERGFDQDLRDVREMVSRGLVEPARAWKLFREIEPDLIRYPALDPDSFRRAVGEFFELPPE
ncbi:MAG: DUF6036 family nucleotidyltransferase [Planctomycetota bacterium]